MSGARVISQIEKFFLLKWYKIFNVPIPRPLPYG
jgi:hypothetical protein